MTLNFDLLGRRIEALGADVRRLDSEIEAIARRLDHFDNSLWTVDSHITALGLQLRNDLAAIDAKMEAKMETGFAAIDARMDAMDAKVEAIDTKMDAGFARLEALLTATKEQK